LKIALKIVATNRFSAFEIVEDIILSESLGQYQGSIATVVRLMSAKFARPVLVIKQSRKGWY
jgi:hypothetical protein